MKRLVREFEFSPQEEEKINRIARELSLTPTTVGILFARGNDDADKMRAFLNPSKKQLLSPFLMQGMKEAKELLTRARDEEWRVAVFGDYDADGIGALAIMSRALRRFGIEPYLYVPERTDGYGMSIAAVDKIFDEFLPDLIVTVDCGISNREEVEYIKEQGGYVIVTDHHELPEVLPDCVVINPKLKDDYPYDNLCGAGVAFKLATALLGEGAYDLIDFAALSTVADSVPLLGENRVLVAEGIKRIAENPRPAISALLGKQGEITAQTLAFTVAPRLNAAGRMGDAGAALKMFTSEDEEEIAELARLLNEYNGARQKYCDELYNLAVAEVYREGAYGNVVMLVGENWNSGTVGIVAARLAEQFNRPALLFVKSGEMLRGSARSIESVNIFEALKACSEYIEEFGGHAQAAGVNVRAENFPLLKKALDNYLGAKYAREDFEPVLYVAGEADEPYRVAKELTLLEPFGVGNRRPQFIAEAGATNASPMKPLSPHICLSSEKLELISFNGAKNLKLLRCALQKQIVIDYNLSVFRGKEQVKGFVRAVTYDGRKGDIGLEAFENALYAMREDALSAEPLPEEALHSKMKKSIEECAYGMLAVCHDRRVLENYPALRSLPAEAFTLSSGSVQNGVLIAPERGADLSAYREIYFLDPPYSGVCTGSAKLYCTEGGLDVADLDCSREGLLSVFGALRRCDTAEAGATLADAARMFSGLEIEKRQLVFSLAVFEELGLVRLDEGRLNIVRGVKTELTNSKIYKAVMAWKEA